jgi:hypothetical protein
MKPKRCFFASNEEARRAACEFNKRGLNAWYGRADEGVYRLHADCTMAEFCAALAACDAKCHYPQ